MRLIIGPNEFEPGDIAEISDVSREIRLKVIRLEPEKPGYLIGRVFWLDGPLTEQPEQSYPINRLFKVMS